MLNIRDLRRRAVAAGLLLFAGGTAAVHAQAVNVDGNGLALKGYDAVAYQTEQRPVLGTTAFTATHEGATYRFKSAANRDAFVADPERYIPVYGGYCAYGVSRGYKVKIEPDAFTVVDGRLYLNYDTDVQQTWRKDIPAYIARADSNWVTLKDQARN